MIAYDQTQLSATPFHLHRKQSSNRDCSTVELVIFRVDYGQLYRHAHDRQI